MPGAIEPEMDELLALDPKRLKTLEVVSTSSTENTHLVFGSPTEADVDAEEFLSKLPKHQPTFTYPFFGQDELWKGVRKGSLTICFDPKSFYAYVAFKVDEDAEDQHEELLCKITSLMPEDGWTNDWKQFVSMCAEFKQQLSSIGTIEDQFTMEHGEYSIISMRFENEVFRKFHARVQILLLFFIEASSYIDDEDEKWRAYMMFKKAENGAFDLVGYTTLYPFLFYPDKIRLRLSQFLILPQFHRLGLGSQLYRHVYQQILSDPEIVELTVEDPSEDFSIFRLTNDYQVYSAFPEPPPRTDLKYSELQWELLGQLDAFRRVKGNENDKQFRLEMKKTLWRRNKETMPDEADKLKLVLQELFDERIDLFKRVLKID